MSTQERMIVGYDRREEKCRAFDCPQVGRCARTFCAIADEPVFASTREAARMIEEAFRQDPPGLLAILASRVVRLPDKIDWWVHRSADWLREQRLLTATVCAVPLGLALWLGIAILVAAAYKLPGTAGAAAVLGGILTAFVALSWWAFRRT